MLSRKPYLLRAIYEWIVDCDDIPFLLVNTTYPGIEAPMQFAQDEKLVLNISVTATQELKLGNDWIEFSARFGGHPQQIRLPVAAILAIYGKDTAQGIMFSNEDAATAEQEAATETSQTRPKATNKPNLKVIK